MVQQVRERAVALADAVSAFLSPADAAVLADLEARATAAEARAEALRAFLAAGFVPVGSEVLLNPN